MRRTARITVGHTENVATNLGDPEKPKMGLDARMSRKRLLKHHPLW